ncbi:MAG: sel1 repeat family protein [Gammaproteobacteria bacterium]|nr:sel1 repeat family protein [Gammaproteobacteria bacterium]
MSIEDELFVEADTAYEQGDLSRAFYLFSQGARNGDVDSMSRLASMYTCGEGVTCDYDKAIEWELNAVNKGSTSALLNIGISYRIKGDIKKAKYWFEKSLSNEDGEAALQLAKLYMVSDKENDKIKKYLNIAINNPNMTDDSLTEAKELLIKYD